MSRPLFSIVIPAYNRSGHLVAAVESVLAQTLTDFEVVIVDDGSTDDTRQSVSEAFAAEPRVRYFFKENEGRSMARNRGIAESQGEWLVFLDSDDLLEPDALEVFIALMAEFPGAELIAGSKSFIDEGGAPIPPPWTENDPEKLFGLIDEPYLRLIRQFFFTPGTFCIRRDRCPQFKQEWDVCEDYEFLLSAAAVCTVARSPRPVHRYRWHSGNTDQGLFAAARLSIADSQTSIVDSIADAGLRRRVRAEWANRRADDYYEQGKSILAFGEYLKAVLGNPSKLSEGQIPRQLLACLVPVKLRRFVRLRRG